MSGISEGDVYKCEDCQRISDSNQTVLIYCPEHDPALDNHAESEDECERCGGTGRVDDLDPISANMGSKPCPDCNDELDSDYQQVKAWLKEPEDDECDYNCDDGVLIRYGEMERCPDCSDESEDNKFGNYDRDEVIPGVEKDTFQNESKEYDEPLPEDGDLVSGLSEKPSYHLQIVVDYIRELEQELEDVREERDELKQTAEFHRLNHKSQAEEAEELLEMMRKYREQRDNLRERIEEARHIAKALTFASHDSFSEPDICFQSYVNGQGENLLEILSDDEGDGDIG